MPLFSTSAETISSEKSTATLQEPIIESAAQNCYSTSVLGKSFNRTMTHMYQRSLQSLASINSIVHLSQNSLRSAHASSSTQGGVNVLRHQTSNAFCRLGQSSPELENRSNHDSKMHCCCFSGRVRIVWLIPSSTTFLSKLRQHLCIHAKSSTSGCSHVCRSRNLTSFGDRTCLSRRTQSLVRTYVANLGFI